MKAEELLKIIKNEIKDYPIDYLKNKAEDDRYPDSATKRLAKYNSEIYDEIFSLKLNENFTVKDNIVENLKKDIDLYFEKYGGDDDLRNFTKYISLYLVLINIFSYYSSFPITINSIVIAINEIIIEIIIGVIYFSIIEMYSIYIMFLI